MKKTKKISIITTILLATLACSSYASTGTVNVSAARLREEANTTSNIITNIYESEKVEILQTEGEWYKVKYGTSEGYLKKEFLTVDAGQASSNETSNTTQNSNNENVTAQNSNSLVATRTVYIKSVPSFVSNTISQISSGTEITNTGKELNKWIQISDGSNTGWILKSSTNYDEINNIEETNEPVNDEENNTTENNVEETNTVEDTTSNETTVQETTSSSNVGKKAVVKVETAKVRKEGNSSAETLGFLDYGDEITIEAEEGDWYKFTSSKISGYVNKTLVTVSNTQTVSSRSLSEPRTQEDTSIVDSQTNDALTQSLTVQTNNSAVVEYAKQYLGYPYVVGGKTPQSGFDCSGFTKYVFSNFGYTLGSTASSQADIGTEVARENIEPGDLLLFYDEAKTKIGHVGIYIGDGDFIHAANPTRGVVTDNLNTNSYYNTRFVTARRIVN